MVPTVVDIEESIMSACIQDQDIACQVVARLDPDDMWTRAYCLLLGEIGKMVTESGVLDLGILRSRMAGQIRDGEIDRLIELVPMAVDIPTSVRQIKEARKKRDLIGVIGKIQAAIDSRDEAVFDMAHREITRIVEPLVSTATSVLASHEMVRQAMLQYRQIADGKAVRKYVTTQFDDLDHILGGLHPGEMTILAARPSVGKTALAMGIAEAAAKSGNGVLFFSLEMSVKSITDRYIACHSGVPVTRLRTGPISQQEMSLIVTAGEGLASMPLYFSDDMSSRSVPVVNRIVNLIGQYKKNNDIKLIVIDYLQLMGGVGANRNYEIEQITRELKLAAIKHDIHVLLLSQLNRLAEGAPPQLSHLRDSGAVEQDADLVIMLHRVGVIDPVRGYSQVDAIVRKNRQGPIGTAHLLWMGDKMKFGAMAKGCAIELEEGEPGKAKNKRKNEWN